MGTAHPFVTYFKCTGTSHNHFGTEQIGKKENLIGKAKCIYLEIGECCSITWVKNAHYRLQDLNNQKSAPSSFFDWIGLNFWEHQTNSKYGIIEIQRRKSVLLNQKQSEGRRVSQSKAKVEDEE